MSELEEETRTKETLTSKRRRNMLKRRRVV
jgi:hypothetical protein